MEKYSGLLLKKGEIIFASLTSITMSRKKQCTNKFALHPASAVLIHIQLRACELGIILIPLYSTCAVGGVN